MTRPGTGAAEPRAHWVLIGAVLLLVGLALALHGYSSGTVLAVPRAPVGKPAPEAARDGGSVIDPLAGDGRDRRSGVRLPDRTIALTFDDGPGPDTPAVLDVLRRHGVPGTFFVLGERVAAQPDVARRLIDEGHEVGVHGFTHADLTASPDWRRRLELDQTQLALSAATGHTSALLRLPYSGTPAELDQRQWRTINAVDGYRVVLADLDSRDWTRPGVERIVADATPESGEGAVVLLHDGGGDRAQTVAALDRLIPAMQAKGYRFSTVSGAFGAAPALAPATTADRAAGWVLLGAVRVGGWLDAAMTVVLVAAGALTLARTAVLIFAASRHRSRERSPRVRPTSVVRPRVSVVVPAYNEEVGIAATLRSLVATGYPDLDIVVVDDGSTDGTATVVQELDLPGVRLLRQTNAGKPVALNAGIAAARHDVLVLVDGDTVFEPDAIDALVAPFADRRVGAVSGNTKVGNRRGVLGRWQHIEYVIGFNLDRRMYDVLGCMPTVPGAIGAFRRAAVRQVGGVGEDTLAEDTDLTMAVTRAGWRVAYAGDAVAWTEAPSSLGQLWRQRYRWSYGTLQAMWKHRGAVLEAGTGGRLGRRGLPYLAVFQLLLPLIAPVVDVWALYALAAQPLAHVAGVWLGFLLVQLAGAWYAFTLDRESPKPLWALPLQQLVYRQLMYLVVIQSVVSAVYGVRLRWHAMRRVGQLDAAPVT
ncbi:MAG TPA: bifunctional polysaccharide deacetylase/glycosyltransferase family 2 protein [Actinomycetales bacterium]|nr:bifunctional polysaccharide deacetylase/glycosyltransferase family 2 protein [Actinomycetales bacterium]